MKQKTAIAAALSLCATLLTVTPSYATDATADMFVANADLSGVTASNISLVGLNLSGIDLTNSTLTNVNLSGATFDNAVLIATCRVSPSLPQTCKMRLFLEAISQVLQSRIQI